MLSFRREARKDEDYDEGVEEGIEEELDQDDYLLGKIADILHSLYGKSDILHSLYGKNKESIDIALAPSQIYCKYRK